jgi:hypothetical protein
MPSLSIFFIPAFLRFSFLPLFQPPFFDSCPSHSTN